MYISTRIKSLTRLIEKQANELLEGTGITVSYTNYLMCLYKEQGISQTALQKMVGFEHPTVVRALDRMARDGFIERRQNQNDRRSFLIYLTNKAEQYKQEVIKTAETINTTLLKNLTDTQCIELEAILVRMMTNLRGE